MSTTEDSPRQEFLSDPTSQLPRVANGSDPAPGDGWQSRLWHALRHAPGRAVAVGLAAGVVAAVVTAVLLLQGATIWTSQTTMIVDDPYGVATAGDEGQLLKLSELRFKYADLASTVAIGQPVATQLDVPVGVVLGATTVEVPDNSLLMSVVGRWTTPGFARQLSQSMAQGISDYVRAENKANGVPAGDQFSASVIGSASPATASRPSRSKAAAAALVVFVGVAVAGFVVAQLLLARRRLS